MKLSMTHGNSPLVSMIQGLAMNTPFPLLLLHLLILFIYINTWFSLHHINTVQSNLDYPDFDYPDFFSGPVFFMNINKL